MASTKFQRSNYKQIDCGHFDPSRIIKIKRIAPSPLTGEGRGEGGQKELGIPLPIIRSVAKAMERQRPSHQGRGVVFYRFSHRRLGFWILKLRFILFLMVCLVMMGCQRQKAGITVAGSTSVEPFAELLAEEYMLRHPQSRIYVQGGGSTAGIEAVRTHAAHVGMSSRSLMAEEKDLYAVTIARDAIAIIVHPTNPVGGLSFTQIRLIFSGRIRNWSEVGGHSRPIVLVTREEGSGTREAFQKLVMEKEEISLDSLVQDSNGAIRQVVSSDPNAIGYISLGLVNEQVRALNISGVEPHLKNIENGKYTLVRPFLFVFNREPNGEAKCFLEFVLSQDAQRMLSKEGLVTILTKKSGE